MVKDVTLSLRIDRKLSDKLERRARQTKRSKSAVAAMLIENSFEAEAQEVAMIKRTLASVRAGEPTVPNEEVIRWIQSWGTANELPRPIARKS